MYLKKLCAGKERAMKGLILAAGNGKRLRPLTNTIPKALIPITGRPLITYPLLRLKKTGIKDIGIVIRPRDYSIFKSNLKIPGINIKYIFQKRPQGTARATKCAADFLENKRFLLCWCDFLSPFEFGKLIKEHLEFKPTATILISKEKDPSGAGQVLFRGHYITRIVEKPRRKLSSWCLTGLLVLEPEIFSVFEKIKPSAEGEYYIPDALQYLIQKDRRIRFTKIDTWRVNINTLADLKLARAKALRYAKLPDSLY